MVPKSINSCFPLAFSSWQTLILFFLGGGGGGGGGGSYEVDTEVNMIVWVLW